MSVKMQGLVGVPIGTEAEQATKLTWLVCMDFKGLVPKGSSLGLCLCLFFSLPNPPLTTLQHSWQAWQPQ